MQQHAAASSNNRAQQAATIGRSKQRPYDQSKPWLSADYAD
jgi:hypothetical protein